MYIDIPTCSSHTASDAALLKWGCTPPVAKAICQLARHCKQRFDEAVRSRYGFDSDESFVIRLRLPHLPDEYIDYKWERRILAILLKFFELEHLMWRMSTLGGACSAMADYDLAFAKRAGVISERQMRIAAELDDHTLLARCYLYIALSEAQQARFVEARKIVNSIYAWTQRTKNEFVEHCCLGVLSKIKAVERFGTKALRNRSSSSQRLSRE